MKKIGSYLISIFIGILLGVGIYTFHYAEGLSYLSNDPKVCVNCHIMREHYDSWQKSSHHAVASCVDCHLPQSFIPKYIAKVRNGFWHSKGFTLQDFHEPIQIKPQNSIILQQNCMRCHNLMVSEISWLAHAKNESVGCVKCHSGVAHGPKS